MWQFIGHHKITYDKHSHIEYIADSQVF